MFKSLRLIHRFSAVSLVMFFLHPMEPAMASTLLERCQARLIKAGLMTSTDYHGHAIPELDASRDDLEVRAFRRWSWMGSNKKFNTYVYESNVLSTGPEPWINHIVTSLESEGGQVRLLHEFGLVPDKNASNRSYFRFNEEAGVPIIAIARNAPRSHVEHEFQHFLDWKALRDQIMLDEKLDRRAAGLKAYKQTFSNPMEIFFTELAAVKRQVEHSNSKDYKDYDAFLRERMVYPEIATIYRWMRGVDAGLYPKNPDHEKMLDDLMVRAIWSMAKYRREQIVGIREKLKVNPKNKKLLRELDKLYIPETLDFETGIYNKPPLFAMYNRLVSREAEELEAFLKAP